MNLLILPLFWWMLMEMRLVSGDCHTGVMDKQWLGIETSTNEDWADLPDQGAFHASLYTNGHWLEWRLLDNAGCTDFQIGFVDYFDDFETIETRWEAIALFNCDTNAVLIEAVYFYNGNDQQLIQSWDPAIFGPFPQDCVYCSGNICGADNAFDIRLDKDYCPCMGAIFGTPTTESDTKGTVWIGARIEPPDCSATYAAFAPPRGMSENVNVNPEPAPAANEFAARLLNYLMIAIVLALLLVVSALCLVNSVVIRNKGYERAYAGSISA
eukprot:UN00294